MSTAHGQPDWLPSAEQVRQAISLYLSTAYEGELPDPVRRRLPPDGFRVREWLMGEAAERDPRQAPLEEVRSFALRLGNREYPNMKLRISRPPYRRRLGGRGPAHREVLPPPQGRAGPRPAGGLVDRMDALPAVHTARGDARASISVAP